MKSLTKCVIASFGACLLFTVTVLLLNCKGIVVSDTLIQYFFITFGVEFAATAAIKIAKSVISRKEITDKIEAIHKEGLQIDKNDLKASKDDDYDDFSQGGYYG